MSKQLLKSFLVSICFSFLTSAVYSQTQALSTIIKSDFDELEFTWNLRNKRCFTYDESNFPASMTYSVFDEGWQNEERLTYIYENGFLQSISAHSWNQDDTDWSIPFWNDHKEYNEDGQLIGSVREYWDGVNLVFVEIEQTTYSYNDDGHLIEAISYWWDFDESDWMEFELWEYLYLGGPLNVAFLSYWATDDWNSADILPIEYDDDNRITMISEPTDWFWNSQEWVYDYNDDGDVFEHSYRSSYDPNLDEWGTNEKRELTYNTEFDYSDLLLPPENFLEDEFIPSEGIAPTNQLIFNHMLLLEEQFEWQMGIWLPSAKVEYYYSDPCVSVNEKSSAEFKMYPNPAQDKVFIESQNSEDLRIQIYDLAGALKHSEKVRSNSNLSLNSLVPGIYVYLILNLEGSVMAKDKLTVTH